MAQDAHAAEKVRGALVRGADGFVYFIPDAPGDPSRVPDDAGTPESALAFRGPAGRAPLGGPGDTLEPSIAGYFIRLETPRSP